MFFGQVIGNLGRNAVVRDGNRGKYVSFSVADTRKYKDSKGQVVESTTWISCTLNNDGGALLQYLLKGQKVYVSGPLSLRMYQNSLGQWEAGVNLSVREIELCGSGAVRAEQQQQQTADFAVTSNAGAPPIAPSNDQQNNSPSQPVGDEPVFPQSFPAADENGAPF